LPVQPDIWFTLAWGGADGGSGVASYDLEYRIAPAGPWKVLSSNVGDLLLEVDVEDRVSYQFRIQPMDWAGNRGDWIESPQTTVSLGGYLSSMTPAVTTYLTSAGGVAGSFYLYNLGGGALNWQAATDQPWLAVSPSSGHLGAGGRTALSLTVPGGLPMGAQAATISFTSDAWKIGGSVRFEAFVVDQVERRFIPLIPQRDGQPAALTADASRRRIKLTR
jgi:hypothetical protein